MSFGLIHHEFLLPGIQTIYAVLAVGWVGIGYALLKSWRQKK